MENKPIKNKKDAIKYLEQANKNIDGAIKNNKISSTRNDLRARQERNKEIINLLKKRGFKW